ncbi:DUF190 domain-containing protein [Zunongwangia sp.]|uniref:DUF190 domain-containing protein n=1 Tax=Zunongwangia sp. TaxID=1965325 RepID=UPI003AA7EFDA
MKDFVTLRVYFEYGQKVHDHSFWRKLYSSDFSIELMKRAKAFGLSQVLHLNVSKGYLENQKINWGITEIRHYKHPHIIEITDSEEKINQFLEEQKKLLLYTSILMVKNEVIVK